MVLQTSKNKIDEIYLLNLREKWGESPEYYFKLIEYYLESKKLIDAKREIDTVKILPLNETQKENLLTYSLILASFEKNRKEFEEIKNMILKIKTRSIFTKINIAVINILEEDYDKALDSLNVIKFESIPADLIKKIFYLKAVSYFYKRDYSSSYKLIQNVLEQEANSKKALYIKTLIEETAEKK